jgi:hypothetical protein
MRPLHSARPGTRATRGHGRYDLARRLPARGLARGLLGSSHDDDEEALGEF